MHNTAAIQARVEEINVDETTTHIVITQPCGCVKTVVWRWPTVTDMASGHRSLAARPSKCRDTDVRCDAHEEEFHRKYL